jgi:capsular exopolysaccharide synthesis family protein
MPLERVIRKLQVADISLLPCGPIPPNPAELISSESMKELIRILSARYDHIIIDSPPLLFASDSVILSTLVDGVILVVRSNKSTRDAVHQSRHMLEGVGARVFGIVLNDIDFRRASNGEYAYYPYANDGKVRDVEGASDILLQ